MGACPVIEFPGHGRAVDHPLPRERIMSFNFQTYADAARISRQLDLRRATPR
jgi:hypothetical protein